MRFRGGHGRGHWRTAFPTAACLAALCLALTAQSPPPAEAPIEAEIVFPSAEALHAFIDAESGDGVVVTSVRGAEARVFLSPAAYARLSAAGHALDVVTKSARKHFDEGYHTYASMTADLEAYALAFPEICRLYSLGTSVQGREIWAMQITDSPDTEEDEPEFKYLATIHGNENLGTEMCMYFIGLLLNGYGTAPHITDLVDETDIWMVPLINPDGLELFQRQNAMFQDLNRNFPVFPNDFTGTFFDGEALGAGGREAETSSIMDWSAANSFVLAANFHSGALAVNYPYDNAPGISSGDDAPSPDDLLFEELSLRYAEQNPPMFASPEFPNGITNGSDWFSIKGGMQDWNYRFLGCLEVTVELFGPPFLPPSGEIPQFWEENRESMLAYLEGVHLGVRGVVTDRHSGAPVWAAISVEGNEQRVYTDPDVGDYYRLLLPGAYRLRVEAPGYIPYTIPNITVEDGPATRRDVVLSNGDVNGDGSIDAADVQAVVNAVLGIADPYGADVNGGGLSATDIQAVILRALFRAE